MTEENDLLVLELRRRAVAGGYSLLDPSLPNIANYRRVIVDATDMADLFSDRSPEEAAVAAEQLARMKGKLGEIISGGAQVVVLLPAPTVGPFEYEEEGQRRSVSPTDALGGPLRYFADAGLQVVDMQDSVRNYFDRIRRVDGQIRSSNPKLTAMTLATGAFGQPLGLEVWVGNGRYVYLPPYSGSPSGAIDIVAADLLDKPRERTAWPDWISVVPFEPVREALAKLHEAEAQAAAANERVQQASDQFERARGPLLVVVDTGTRLQKACEQLFQTMGIETEPVRADVSDEFMLCGAACPILVEVKGLEGPAKKADLTQVLADAANWEEREKRDVKPLLLANSHRLLPIEEREARENRPFSQWIEDNAPRLGVAFMTTWDLLRVYYAASSNPQLAEELLQGIIETSGRVDVNKLLGSNGGGRDDA